MSVLAAGSKPITVIVATGNRGKLREIVSILGEEQFRFITLNEIGFQGEIVEDGETFQANAALKAEGIARWIDQNRLEIERPVWILSDDSGLEVDALGGAPGIRSARYSGPQATDSDNIARLLCDLTNEENRAAQFCCTLCVVKSDRPGEWSAPDFTRGECRGVILRAGRGENGFGYDPLFVPAGESRTFAEMTGEEKKFFSHRGEALRQLRTKLSGL